MSKKPNYKHMISTSSRLYKTLQLRALLKSVLCRQTSSMVCWSMNALS